MAIISNPFIRYRCADCGREIERQISAKRALLEMDELRNGPDLYCAECWQPPLPTLVEADGNEAGKK